MVIDYKSFNEKGNPQVHSTSQERMKDVFITEEMIQLEKNHHLTVPSYTDSGKDHQWMLYLDYQAGFQDPTKRLWHFPQFMTENSIFFQ